MTRIHILRNGFGDLIIDPYWDVDDWHAAARGDGRSYSTTGESVTRLPGESDAALLDRAETLLWEMEDIARRERQRRASGRAH